MSETKRSSKSGSHEIATISAGELAEALGVDDRTVRKWIEDAQVVPDARTLGGHARFFPSTLEKLKRAARSG
jgi:excisionase family DNA binding protein